jgi:hypothetical protein
LEYSPKETLGNADKGAGSPPNMAAECNVLN